VSTKTAPVSAAAPPEDAELAALRRDLTFNRTFSRAVQGFVALIILVITAYGTSNAHQALHRHDTPDPWGWMLYPAVEAALIVELQAGAYVGGMLRRILKAQQADGGQADKASKANWGMAMRLATAVAALVLNIWYPLEVHDGRGGVLHGIGPVLQIFIVEALAHYRDAFNEIDRHLLDAIAAREVALAPPAPAPRQRPVPAPRPPVVPSSSPREEAQLVPSSPPEEDGASPSSPPRPPEQEDAVPPPVDVPSPPKETEEDDDGELRDAGRIGIARLKGRGMNPTRDLLKTEMGMSSKRASRAINLVREEIRTIPAATAEELAAIPDPHDRTLHLVENAS
jgi:hypothetical protein